MNAAISIKRLLSLVIVLCFFLPLSKCSTEVAAPPPGSTHIQPALEKKEEILVPAKAIDGSLAAVLLVAAFAWPLVAWAFPHKSWSRRSQVVAYAAEAMLGFCSGAYLSLVIYTYGTPQYGGVIVVSSYVIFAVLCAWMGVMQWRERSPAA